MMGAGVGQEIVVVVMRRDRRFDHQLHGTCDRCVIRSIGRSKCDRQRIWSPPVRWFLRAEYRQMCLVSKAVARSIDSITIFLVSGSVNALHCLVGIKRYLIAVDTN